MRNISLQTNVLPNKIQAGTILEENRELRDEYNIFEYEKEIYDIFGNDNDSEMIIVSNKLNRS